MPEIIDNRSYLYADDTKNFGNGFDLSSIQTDLSNVLIWAAKTELNSISTSLTKLENKNRNKRYPFSDISLFDGEQIVLKDTVKDFGVWCNFKMSWI